MQAWRPVVSISVRDMMGGYKKSFIFSTILDKLVALWGIV
jgi:hypothetical protein